MIKPKYRKNLDAAQLAHTAVERLIGGKLKPPKPTHPQAAKKPSRKSAKGH